MSYDGDKLEIFYLDTSLNKKVNVCCYNRNKYV